DPRGAVRRCRGCQFRHAHRRASFSPIRRRLEGLSERRHAAAKENRSGAAATAAARRKSLARFRARLPLHARPNRARCNALVGAWGPRQSTTPRRPGRSPFLCRWRFPPEFPPAGLPHVAGSRPRAQRGRTLAPASRGSRLSRSHYSVLGQRTATGSAGARGALPRGAGNTIRTKGYRDVEGSLLASSQSLSPQSLDVENTPLVFSARRQIRVRPVISRAPTIEMHLRFLTPLQCPTRECTP